jgi:hypothetical protein
MMYFLNIIWQKSLKQPAIKAFFMGNSNEIRHKIGTNMNVFFIWNHLVKNNSASHSSSRVFFQCIPILLQSSYSRFLSGERLSLYDYMWYMYMCTTKERNNNSRQSIYHLQLATIVPVRSYLGTNVCEFHIVTIDMSLLITCMWSVLEISNEIHVVQRCQMFHTGTSVST